MMDHNRQLLKRFLTNTCSSDELHKALSLLETDEGNRMLLEIFKQREQPILNVPHKDTPAMEERFKVRRAEIQERVSGYKKRYRPFPGRTLMRVAAVFAGVMILGGVAVWRGDDGAGLFGGGGVAIEFAELSNPGGVPQLHVLGDGTQVWLAAGSTLTYPTEFERKRRDVELVGEAFFDVARDEKRPFTIKTGDMETRVLGTSFKITAFEGHEHEVAVATGKVSVSNGNTELALLTRGASVRYDLATGETTQAEIDPASLEGWKTGTLTFDEQPMGFVAEQLALRFGIEIEFADTSIANRHVRGVFDADEQVDDVLDMLAFIGKFQHRNTDEKNYIIY